MHYISNLTISRLSHFNFFLNRGIENKEVTKIKFLGLWLDKHVEWKTHVELMIPKMSSACYAVRSVYSFSDMTTHKIIYFLYFHSIVEYGITFQGNSSNSRKNFHLQKKIIIIMTWSKRTDSHETFIPNIRNTDFTMSIYTILDKFFDSQFGVFHF